MRDAMNKRISQLVSLYQEHLGLYVTPVDSEVTHFAFVKIDASAWTRRFAFSVNVAGGSYSIALLPDSFLPAGVIDELQQRLNATQDFFGFLRAIRKAFKASLSAPEKQ